MSEAEQLAVYVVFAIVAVLAFGCGNLVGRMRERSEWLDDLRNGGRKVVSQFEIWPC